MANVLLIGLEQSIAAQISRVLAAGRHRIEQQSQDLGIRDLSHVDIVFAGGDASEYLPRLHWARRERPALPFVVVTRVPETISWLNALEAGATDVCSPPFEAPQIRWLMESLSSRYTQQLHRRAAE